jgi:hypothetical protein
VDTDLLANDDGMRCPWRPPLGWPKVCKGKADCRLLSAGVGLVARNRMQHPTKCAVKVPNR